MSLIDQINHGPLTQAFRHLPSAMDSLRARGQILKTGLQESRLIHRHQIGGPAHGLFQFELGGGVRGVMRHESTSYHARRLAGALSVTQTEQGVFNALEFNDVLACGMARLNYWWHPKGLPAIDDEEGSWQYYLFCWRPGAVKRDYDGLREKWGRNHAAVLEALRND